MDSLLPAIILVLVSGAIVFIAVYFIVREFFMNEARKRAAELRAGVEAQVVPARMQAYERIVLFLERVAPSSLIMRVHKNGMTSRQLQAELVRSIRHEYEHNISQQVYISAQAWESVKSAKEETIKMINIASTKVPDHATGIDLSQKIFEIGTQLHKLPTDIALEMIKKEFNASF
ncbi:MAG: hypothetical protein IT233_11745 [Bacteroidia bacterium]|nr:hypothetical protein [Bacteroidia bacterium]